MIDRQAVASAQWRALMPTDHGTASSLRAEVSLDYASFFLREYAPVVRTVTLMLRDEARAE
jgi:RNA polymerase sigma factor (sigma-70 family)